jgi:hypothetical protein
MSSTTKMAKRKEHKNAMPDRATRVAVAAVGLLAALAGIEHGIGEILQGWVAPSSVVFESWPDTAGFEILSGEPATSLIPNLALSGLLTVVVAIAVGVWAT